MYFQVNYHVLKLVNHITLHVSDISEVLVAAHTGPRPGLEPPSIMERVPGVDRQVLGAGGWRWSWEASGLHCGVDRAGQGPIEGGAVEATVSQVGRAEVQFHSESPAQAVVGHGGQLLHVGPLEAWHAGQRHRVQPVNLVLIAGGHGGS